MTATFSGTWLERHPNVLRVDEIRDDGKPGALLLFRRLDTPAEGEKDPARHARLLFDDALLTQGYGVRAAAGFGLVLRDEDAVLELTLEEADRYDATLPLARRDLK